MKFNCNIKVKHNYKKINTIIQKLPEIKNIILEDILKNIQGYAIRLEKRTQRRRYNMRNDRYVY